jgi:hypothetical protein
MVKISLAGKDYITTRRACELLGVKSNLLHYYIRNNRLSTHTLDNIMLVELNSLMTLNHEREEHKNQSTE